MAHHSPIHILAAPPIRIRRGATAPKKKQFRRIFKNAFSTVDTWEGEGKGCGRAVVHWRYATTLHRGSRTRLEHVRPASRGSEARENGGHEFTRRGHGGPQQLRQSESVPRKPSARSRLIRRSERRPLDPRLATDAARWRGGRGPASRRARGAGAERRARATERAAGGSDECSAAYTRGGGRGRLEGAHDDERGDAETGNGGSIPQPWDSGR